MGQPQPSLPPPSFCHPFFCHSLFHLFSFFLLSPKFSVCQTGMARAFSPYLPRRAHFTWGVAPGWYRSGLWPLLSLFSDQSANGAPYTTLGQRPTKRPTPRSPSTIQGLNARSITAGRSPIDAPGDGRAPGVVAFSNAPADPRQSFPPIFLPSIFLPFPLSPFFVSFGYHRKITRRFFRFAEKRKRKRKNVTALFLPFAVPILTTRGPTRCWEERNPQHSTLNVQRSTLMLGRRVGCPSGCEHR